MSKDRMGSVGTRRDFLLGLARVTAYVPPLIATLRGDPLSAGGRGSAAATVFGGLSPSASLQSREAPTFQAAPESSTGSQATPESAPWAAPPPEAPWSQPPPGGGEEE